jgi:hypothetical protein
LPSLTNIHGTDQVSTTAGVGAKAAQSGIRKRTVVLYLGMALAVLVPGLALKAGFNAGSLRTLSHAGLSDLDTYLTVMQQAMREIEFGGGIRFWLGVSGTAMLGSLLLYPIRKMLANRRGVGSVGGWFHLHILLGIIGPVLILYHCNFGHGSLNANVALWTMLLVAGSGIIGYFVYGRVSASFYNSRQQAQTHRNAVLASIPDTALFQAGKDQLIAKFEAFEAELLTPRQGLLASVSARLRLERRRREISNDVGTLVVETARSRGDAPPAFQQFRRLVGRHVWAYFGIARAAASQSILEQLWSRWRLLHMPMFLIMIVAASLHVIAIWDREPAVADTNPAAAIVAQAHTAQRASAPEKAVTQPAGKGSVAVADQLSATSPVDSTIRIVKRPVLTTRPATDASSKHLSEGLSAPVPQPARRPAASLPNQTAAARPDGTMPATELGAAAPRRIEELPMALGGSSGGGKTSSLDTMFAAFKAKQQAGEFSHSDIETGFLLTGKHLKLDCASCHNAPLPVTRQNTAARTCLSCHQKDDNHSGRRPDCAKCHTTNRWKQRIR